MAKRHNMYLIKGNKVPSVTTILNIINKPELVAWQLRMGEKAEEIVKAAADFGSSVHSAIEAVVMGQDPYFSNDKLKTVVSNFQKWADNNIQEWITFEKAVFHDELLYAGTIDAIATLKNGKKVLVDFKTSKKVRAEYYLQVAAYMNGTRIEDDVVDLSKLDGAIIVHLDHDTLTWESVHAHTDGLFDVFKAALQLYNWRLKNP